MAKLAFKGARPFTKFKSAAPASTAVHMAKSGRGTPGKMTSGATHPASHAEFEKLGC